MSKFILVLFILTLSSCKCQKEKKSTLEKYSSETTNEVFTIEGFITEGTYSILLNFTDISVYSIEKSLISGTTDEYSNKSIFSKKLNQDSAVKLISFLLDDASYEWQNHNETISFEPTIQLVVKSGNAQVNVMYDSNNQVLSFFTLEGPSNVKVSNKLHQKLSALL